jgi:hypothetical protein
MTSDVHHFLSVKSRQRQKRIDKTKTPHHKKKHKMLEHERLKKETKEAVVTRKKRHGTHKSRIGMTKGCNEEEIDVQKKKPAKQTTKSGTCTQCGEVGHLCPTNKNCKHCIPSGQASQKGGAK